MKTRLLLAVAFVLIWLTSINAQKYYELNEVKQIPSLDEENMAGIAYWVAELSKEIYKNPVDFSTDRAVSNTICLFYDTDGDNVLNKINPRNGAKYTLERKSELEHNDNLLFSLCFDENGVLLAPEKICIISFHEYEEDRTIKQTGHLAFELTIPDSIKTVLNGLRLKTVAKADKNSLTGDLMPVKISIPFKLGYKSETPSEISGTAIKRDDFIDISLSRKFYSAEEKTQLIELLKTNTMILKYKKGSFQFVIEEIPYNYNIDLNIGRDMVYTSQPTSFTLFSNSVKSFQVKEN